MIGERILIDNSYYFISSFTLSYLNELNNNYIITDDFVSALCKFGIINNDAKIIIECKYKLNELDKLVNDFINIIRKEKIRLIKELLK